MFRLSQEQRQQCIAKFNKATVELIAKVTSAIGNVPIAVAVSNQSQELCSSSVSDSHGSSFGQDIIVGRFGPLSQRVLSVPLDTVVADTRFPYTTVEGIWKNVIGLVSEDCAIVTAPGLGQRIEWLNKRVDLSHIC